MKLNKNFFYSMLLALGLLAQGCSYRVTKDTGNFETMFIPAELLESVSYQEVKNKIFIPKCISCHGDAGQVNLESYATTRSFLNQIAQSTLIEKRMPKSDFEPLTQSEYLLLAAWIKSGGPELPLSGQGAPTPLPNETLTPTFLSIKKIILDRKCVSCHKKDGEAPRVLLDTPQEMIDSPLEILLPGNPEESGLVLTLDRENAVKPMPPLKSSLSPVTPAELEVIKEWIQKGAKD